MYENTLIVKKPQTKTNYAHGCKISLHDTLVIFGPSLSLHAFFMVVGPWNLGDIIKGNEQDSFQ